ncbi:acyl-coenzyme A synthetase ACSM3, mitochondrial isoform X2 [Lepisosteus oculatus]|uniref:acyl-coenzyme A synthetase ACSM3, mitochondrial isoform X2 n=1 Tax=Lepisosteus oculatus TaxID=7918 RepID=UPI0035F528B8
MAKVAFSLKVLKGPGRGCRSILALVGTRHQRRGHLSSVPRNFEDYESLRKIHNPQVPEHFNFAKDVIDKWAEKEKLGGRAESPAFWWVNDGGDQIRWTFEELALHSRRTANVLSGPCDLQRGDRVLLILPRLPEWWLVNVACMRTGTVLIPGTSQLTARDILQRLRVSQAKCIITDESLAPVIDAISPECSWLKAKLLVSNKKQDGWMNLTELSKTVSSEHTCMQTRSDDPMTIFFTSGTTGSPKMTQHTHCSYGIGLAVNGRFWLDLTEEDVLWNTSDTGWAKSAWSSVFAPWTQGACVFVHRMAQFHPRTVLETLSKYPISAFCSAPTAYRMLMQEDISRYRFPYLKHCVCAGEPVNPDLLEKWKDHTGLDIYEGYGQTETDDAVSTALCYRGDFYLTGDRGLMDEDGYLWFFGRADDVILSAGYRIGPFEVENALAEHEAVAESAVVSSPDPVRGEVVKAFVVLTPEYAAHDKQQLAAELQKHVKQVTAPYKYPRKIEFVEQLPKTVSGKIRRLELRNKEWGHS